MSPNKTNGHRERKRRWHVKVARVRRTRSVLLPVVGLWHAHPDGGPALIHGPFVVSGVFLNTARWGLLSLEWRQ